MVFKLQLIVYDPGASTNIPVASIDHPNALVNLLETSSRVTGIAATVPGTSADLNRTPNNVPGALANAKLPKDILRTLLKSTKIIGNFETPEYPITSSEFSKTSFKVP